MENNETPSHLQKVGVVETLHPESVFRDENVEWSTFLTEHLADLAQVVEMPLKLVCVEHRIGDRKIDLLARNSETEGNVVIESQILSGRSSEDNHLGRLFLYASAMHAAAAIWIAPVIRDEYKQTITWINSMVNEKVAFFAVSFELLRIEQSPPAVRFFLEAGPSQFQRDFDNSLKIAPGVTPVRFCWKDHPDQIKSTSSWKKIYRSILEEAIKQGVDLRKLNIKCANFPYPPEGKSYVRPINLCDDKGEFMVEGHGDAKFTQRRISSVLDYIDKSIVVTLRDGRTIYLPQKRDLAYIQRANKAGDDSHHSSNL